MIKSSLFYRILPVIFVAVIFQGCAMAHKESCPTFQHNYPKEVPMEKATFSFSQSEKPYELLPEYKISPGDVLDVVFQIHTWAEVKEFKIGIDNRVSIKFIHTPELNESQMVRPDGNISLPYLGEMKVVGKTVGELTAELKQKYTNILKEPELYVTVPEFRSGLKELKADLHDSGNGLGRLTSVRQDGYATFPMIGDVFVANHTISEMTKALNERYESFLPGLQVDLFLKTQTGSKLYVLGMVAKPGAYSIKKPVSVLEALAISGGFLQGAQLRSVVVLRKNDDGYFARRININDVLKCKKGANLFFLYPDDVLYIPKNFISTASDLGKDLSNILFFKGVGFSFSYDLDDNPQDTTVVAP
jgi:polysaccharide export outer membrane protein